MRIEPNQNLADIQSLADYLKNGDGYLLLSHVNPDGDAIGSMVALGEGLMSLGKTVKLFNRSGVPSLYTFLPYTEEVTDCLDSLDAYKAVILLDCHSLKRAGIRADQVNWIPVLGILDHHEVGTPEKSTVTVIDPNISATGELVYQLLLAMGVNITGQMATNLYTAISTDTGSFNYDNTTASCLEVAADLVRLGANPWDIYRQLNFNLSPERLLLLSQALKNMEYYHKGKLGALTISSDMMAATGTSEIDTDDFVSYPRSVKGVELALLISENGDGVCHVSLRSEGKVDAAALARRFGGGGHRKAAGFSRAGALEEVKNQVVAAAASYLSRDGKRERV